MPDAEIRVIGDGMLEDKAKELGRIIGQSAEYQAVKKSSEALNGDRVAVSVLQEMEKLRVQAQQMIQRGEEPTAELEQQLDDLLMKVQGNPVYQRAISAQENFDKVMYQVNNWIMDGMKKGATSSIITLG
ncbi:MAG: YlbF family regulator [Gemmatimonadaceae bacterium]